MVLLYCRTYTIPATSVKPGNDLLVTVTLTKADNNTANNDDSVPVTLWTVCGDPFGNGTQGTCPPPLQFVGQPDTPIFANSTFEVQCCVSGPMQR
jgi:hypothetical protein